MYIVSTCVCTDVLCGVAVGLSLAAVESSKLKAFVQVVDSVKEHVKTLAYIGKGDEALLQKARDAGLKVRAIGCGAAVNGACLIVLPHGCVLVRCCW